MGVCSSARKCARTQFQKSLIPFMNIPLRALERSPLFPPLFEREGVGGEFQCPKMRKNTIPKSLIPFILLIIIIYFNIYNLLNLQLFINFKNINQPFFPLFHKKPRETSHLGLFRAENPAFRVSQPWVNPGLFPLLLRKSWLFHP